MGKSFEYFDKARPERVIANERHENTLKAINGANLKNSNVISVFDTFSYFCPNKDKFCLNRKGNIGFYDDDDHLSAAGSEWLGSFFLKHLNNN